MAAVPVSAEESGLFGITKRMLSFGRGSIPEYTENTQVEIHWQSRFAGDVTHDDHAHSDHCCSGISSGTILDDSRKIFGKDRPMTVVLGRSFRLPLLESCVKTMCVGEVAAFTVTDSKLISAYPAFAASLRSLGSANPTRGHCCAGMAQTAAYGHHDLDELVKNPKIPLEFVIELCAVHPPGQYNQERWQMSDDDRAASLDRCREEGNRLCAAKEWRQAATVYSEALETIDHLCSRDKPGEPEWKEFDDKKIVFYNNLAQCQLQLEDYIGAIDSCSQVLRRDRKNTKALFRRARAYAKTWEEEKAFQDWATVVKLDPSLTQTVMRESNDFRQLLEAHKKVEADRFKTAFAHK